MTNKKKYPAAELSDNNGYIKIGDDFGSYHWHMYNKRSIGFVLRETDRNSFWDNVQRIRKLNGSRFGETLYLHPTPRTKWKQ